MSHQLLQLAQATRSRGCDRCCTNICSSKCSLIAVERCYAIDYIEMICLFFSLLDGNMVSYIQIFIGLILLYTCIHGEVNFYIFRLPWGVGNDRVSLCVNYPWRHNVVTLSECWPHLWQCVGSYNYDLTCYMNFGTIPCSSHRVQSSLNAPPSKWR